MNKQRLKAIFAMAVLAALAYWIAGAVGGPMVKDLFRTEAAYQSFVSAGAGFGNEMLKVVVVAAAVFTAIMAITILVALLFGGDSPQQQPAPPAAPDAPDYEAVLYLDDINGHSYRIKVFPTTIWVERQQPYSPNMPFSRAGGYGSVYNGRSWHLAGLLALIGDYRSELSKGEGE